MNKTLLLLLFILVIQSLHGQIPDGWQTSGITTVHGTIANFKKYSKDFNSIEIQVDDWTNASRRKYFAKIDEDGKFSVSFFVFNTQQVIFIYKNHWPGISVSPNDTLKLLINADSFPEDIEYIGKTSRICEIIDDFNNNRQDSIFSISNSKLNSELRDSLSFELYKTWRDSIYQVEIRKTEIYLSQISTDPYIANWVTSLVQFRYYFDLIRYNPIKRIKSNDECLQYLITIINTLDLDTVLFNPTISPLYSSLINALYSKVYDIATFYRIQTQESQYPLPPENNPENNSVVPYIPRSKNTRTLELSPFYYKAAQLLTNSKVKESVLAHYYTKTLEGQNLDLGLDSILTQISDDKIKASLINEYNSYKWRTTNQNSLKVNSAKETLLDELKSKYKGYVLYIDFWGTWCSPCYESFISSPKINKIFKNQKVAFIYLCCHCDKNKWEKDIKDYNLEGENIFLTSEQYTIFANELNIIGVPRFIIVDKSGKIVNENAPRPTSNIPMQKKLADELTKYLNEDN